VPVFKILEEQLGLTRLEVSKFGQTAKGADTIRRALVRGLDKSFGGATAERVKNLSTQMSNLGIAFTNAQDILGQGLSKELGTAIDNVTDFININEELITQLGEGLGRGINAGIKGVGNLVENFDLLKEILIAIVGLKVAIVIAQITTSVKGLSSAMAILNGVIARNPIFIIGGTAITALALFGDKLSALKGELKDTQIEIDGNTTSLNEFKNTIKELDVEQQIISFEKLKSALRLQIVEQQDLVSVLEEEGVIRRNGLDIILEETDVLRDLSHENKLLFDLLTQQSYVEGQLRKLRENLTTSTDENSDAVDENSDALQNNINKQKQSIDLIKKTLDARKQFETETMAKIREFDPARAEIEAEANKQAELEKLRNDGYISEQKYKVLSEDLATQSNTRLYELFKQGKLDELDFARISEDTKQSILVSSARDILTQLSSTNKKAFQIYKAFAMGEAIISTYQGVAKGLAKGFPLGYIEAGITLAKGMAQVNAIKSQQFQGRALGGPVAENKPYMVGEQGPEIMIPNQNGRIIPNKELGGQTVVNVNILANDTQGFDELLIKRRSTIVNVINDALNSQGKEALI